MTSEAKPLDLRQRAERRQVLTYQVITQVRQQARRGEHVLGSQATSWESTLRTRVLAVEPDGSRHAVHVLEPGALPAEAAGMGIHAVRDVTYDHVDDRGRLRETSSHGPSPGCLLPDAPVAVGDTWDANLPLSLPTLPEPLDCHWHYRVSDVHAVNGYECAEITFHTDEVEAIIAMPADQQARLRLQSQGRFSFALSEGLMVRLQIEVESRPEVAGITYETITETTQQLTGVGKAE